MKETESFITISFKSLQNLLATLMTLHWKSKTILTFSSRLQFFVYFKLNLTNKDFLDVISDESIESAPHPGKGSTDYN